MGTNAKNRTLSVLREIFKVRPCSKSEHQKNFLTHIDHECIQNRPIGAYLAILYIGQFFQVARFCIARSRQQRAKK